MSDLIRNSIIACVVFAQVGNVLPKKVPTPPAVPSATTPEPAMSQVEFKNALNHQTSAEVQALLEKFSPDTFGALLSSLKPNVFGQWLAACDDQHFEALLSAASREQFIKLLSMLDNEKFSKWEDRVQAFFEEKQKSISTKFKFGVAGDIAADDFKNAAEAMLNFKEVVGNFRTKFQNSGLEKYKQDGIKAYIIRLTADDVALAGRYAGKTKGRRDILLPKFADTRAAIAALIVRLKKPLNPLAATDLEQFGKNVAALQAKLEELASLQEEAKQLLIAISPAQEAKDRTFQAEFAALKGKHDHAVQLKKQQAIDDLGAQRAVVEGLLGGADLNKLEEARAKLEKLIVDAHSAGMTDVDLAAFKALLEQLLAKLQQLRDINAAADAVIAKHLQVQLLNLTESLEELKIKLTRK